MKLSIMQPYFFPYIGYFQLLNAADKFIIYDDVQYIKRGWINRNYILSKDGRTLLTVPVQKTNTDSRINEVLVSGTKWKKKLINSVYLTYKKAPYFEKTMPLIEEVLNLESDYIIDYANGSIRIIIDNLKLDVNLELSSEIEYNNDLDKVDKINQIISKEGADKFILPPGSINLYKKEDFTIDTFFLNPSNISYKQFSSSRFEKNLSIIDVLMFNNRNEVNSLLNQYTLK